MRMTDTGSSFMPRCTETVIDVNVMSTCMPPTPYASLMRSTIATTSAADAPVASIASPTRRHRSMTSRTWR